MRAKPPIAVLLLALAVSAQGQTSLTISAESDYRYRGVPLSNGKPVLRLSLDHDDAAGWYAGTSALDVTLYSRRHQVQGLGYLGFAQRTALGAAWELGAMRNLFTLEPRYDFSEAFAGVSAERWNLRASYSPSYFGLGQRTLYAELNGGLPIGSGWRVAGHLGTLANLDRSGFRRGQRRTVDTRWGISAPIGDAEWQLARVDGDRGGPYPITATGRRNTWVLGTSVSW